MDKFLGQKERRKSSTYKVFLGDYQKLSQNAALRKMLEKNGESGKILFADLVVKVNRKNKMQDRLIVVTEAAIYNLDPGSLKVRRRILLGDISRISLSNLPDNFFVIHVPKEYDYLLVSRRKIEIVSQIMKAYEQSEHKPLEIHISSSFDYRIDSQVTREIRFTKVDMGVNTAIYTHHGPK